jgi:8-oxo-dGTP diphosphatase
MDMLFVDKVAWIYLQGGKILSTRSRGKDTYYIPGGKREVGETDTQCLTREIQEELSVSLVPESFDFVGEFEAMAHGKNILIKMRCYTADFTGQLKTDSEIEEMVWFTYADRDKGSAVDQKIFDYLRDKGLLNV